MIIQLNVVYIYLLIEQFIYLIANVLTYFYPLI